MNAPPSPHGVADWPRMIGSLLLATLVALAPWGQSPIIPDVLALVLAWWALHRPQRGLLAAGFMLGVLMDTHTASTLGEHALLYTLIVWMTLQFQRRIAWFRLGGQMLHMLGIFLMAQAVLAGARFLLGLPFLGPEQFLPWLGTALLWPLADLLLPARHAPRRKTNGAAAYGPRTAPLSIRSGWQVKKPAGTLRHRLAYRSTHTPTSRLQPPTVTRPPPHRHHKPRVLRPPGSIRKSWSCRGQPRPNPSLNTRRAGDRPTGITRQTTTATERRASWPCVVRPSPPVRPASIAGC